MNGDVEFEPLQEAAEEEFDDDPGDQPYDAVDVPPDREVVTTPYDPPVKSLLDDIKAKDLIVNPEFQRRSVWDRVRKSRLVESLLLNVPIPVIFLAEDKDGTRVVVDGQQRLRAIEEFASGRYALSGLQVLPTLNGKRWIDLTPRQARLISNRTLRCIVVSASSDPNLRFEIFERLNVGGMALTDQELRNSIYRGSFNALLNELASSRKWLALVRRSEPDNRLGHHEMILRFLSMEPGLKNYRPPLKKWLNDFMKDNRQAPAARLEEFRAQFNRAADRVGLVFGVTAAPPFRRARTVDGGRIGWDNTLNRPAFDLQMLGLMDASEDDLRPKARAIVTAFAELCVENEDFSDALSRATADRTRTITRVTEWAKVLDRLEVPNRLAARLVEGA